MNTFEACQAGVSLPNLAISEPLLKSPGPRGGDSLDYDDEVGGGRDRIGVVLESCYPRVFVEYLRVL